MNPLFDRQLVSQFVIIVGVCVFGWILIVQPQTRELAELEQVIAEAKSHPMLLDQISIEKMADKMAGVRNQVRLAQLKNQFAADTSRRYSLIMDLASDHQVVVHQLDPGSIGESLDKSHEHQSARFNLVIEGHYVQVAKFLDAINQIDGFVKPTSLKITPRGYLQDAQVQATVICEALSFSLPEQLQAMAGVQQP